MKKLRVCLSSDLPEILDRSPEYLYFTYDKLNLYSGQNDIDENYVIAESIPEAQVPGMIYILNTDGSVHRKIDYEDVQIAEIEDDSQIEILRKAGTLYMVDANRRYFDSQKRLLTLPFNDGKYEMAVAVRDEHQVFDDNTIIKYNTKKERFEMYGDTSEEFIDFSKPFRGGKTDSMEIAVDGSRIYAKVRINPSVNNILRIASDGLYARTFDKVDNETFEEWSKTVSEFKAYAKNILDNIDSEIINMENIVSPEQILQNIYNILSSKFGEIQVAIDNYDNVVTKMSQLESKLMGYTQAEVVTARTNVEETLEKNSNWEELDDTSASLTQEIDYYKKDYDYWHPSMTNVTLKTLITAAINGFLAVEKDNV